MGMRVISRRRIEEFVRKHPTAKPSLEQWYRVVKQATWKSLAEAKQVYPHADLVGKRTVFNIAGNNFRLIARINYRVQALYILSILTHAEYSKEEWEK
ncbi:MAG TPA: type II toxin-antitoxin system HigB family toxin [Candidatus Binatia bacterium]|jgi:mRNA interferase HigB|nr:type II toxin-antitoxin system HigB family toxin [Candidatus Binatia bacterium]